MRKELAPLSNWGSRYCNLLKNHTVWARCDFRAQGLLVAGETGSRDLGPQARLGEREPLDLGGGRPQTPSIFELDFRLAHIWEQPQLVVRTSQTAALLLRHLRHSRRTLSN
jgi:hypothetical protein